MTKLYRVSEALSAVEQKKSKKNMCNCFHLIVIYQHWASEGHMENSTKHFLEAILSSVRLLWGGMVSISINTIFSMPGVVNRKKSMAQF